MLRISLVATFLSLISACWTPPQYDGPLCDTIVNGEPWPSDGQAHDLDHINSAPWLENPQMTEYLFGFGMSKAEDTWLGLGLDDPYAYNEETLLVDSPFGRAMNAYTQIALSGTDGEYLDVTVSLEDFEHYDNMLKWFAGYVYQHTWRIAGSCGNKPLIAASTYFGRLLSKRKLIIVYDGFFYSNSVYRAATIVHEVRHTDVGYHTAEDLCASCDNSWTDRGATTYGLLWLAAYYWAPENEYISPRHRIVAEIAFNETKERFREPMEWTLADFEDINENPEYYLKIATLYNDVRPR